jgi:drug/metabolite transporter (DMT)-like permease
MAKYLATSEGMAPGQVAFYRFLFQLIATVPVVVVAEGLLALRPKRLWLNLLRGTLLAAASLFFFTAVKYMPLADSIAIFFVEPFILTGLSALILRERVGWRRWTAIAVGFVGAVLVINPSFDRFGAVALLPLVTATLFSFYMLMNRALGTVDSPLVMQYAAGIGGSLFVGLTLLAGGVGGGIDDLQPSAPQSALAWTLVLVLGALAGYGHLLVVKAFQHAPASLLAPFQYLEIVSAVILGYIFFSDFPDASKLLGIAIIVGSGLFIVWRERRCADQD